MQTDQGVYLKIKKTSRDFELLQRVFLRVCKKDDYNLANTDFSLEITLI